MAEMYNWDKSDRNTQNPSFSSCLLDEIYRSIDGGDEKFGEFKLRKQKVLKKPTVKSGGNGGNSGGNSGGNGGGSRGRSKSKSAVEDEEIAVSRHACLVDKWMEMKGNKKVATGAPTLPEFDQKFVLDNDPMFFSSGSGSGSSSSDSSFGWYSEAEAVKPKPSCFGPLNRVKTSVPSRSAVKKQNGLYLSDHFDDDQTDKADDNSGLIRSKTRALKIYTSLKKVKQPISPGGRLTTFINAIFTNGHSKKSKDFGCEDKTQTRSERKSKSTNVSTCSSASSFSTSCLNKNLPRSTDRLSNGVRRTVTFLDRDDSCSNGRKNKAKDFMKLQPTTTFPWPRTEKPHFNEILMKYNDKKIDLDDDDDDDMASDSSSDLFELDHLAMFKDDQYCEELPVYETCYMGTNRAIARGLVC